MARNAVTLRLPRPAAAALGLGGVGLAALGLEAALGLALLALEWRRPPRPYLLSHLLAGGSLVNGLGALALADRILAGTVPNRSLRRALRLFGGGFVGLVLYGCYLEPRWLETPEVEVRLDGLPPGLDGLRIALISDVHAGPNFGWHDMERVLHAANALRPDLVVLLGDFVSRDPAGAAVVVAAVPRFAAPLGVYAILGNHDFWMDHAAVTRALVEAGARVLRNAGVAVERGAARLWLAGVDDLKWGVPDLAAALGGAAEGDFPILLAHNPLLVRAAAHRRLPLVLAGHTHGGQVRLPWVGPLILPVNDRGLAAGLVRRGPTQLYVTRGVGMGAPPVRLGARPEVPLLVLRRYPV